MAETLPIASTIEAPLSEHPVKAENVFVDGGGRWSLVAAFQNSSGFGKVALSRAAHSVREERVTTV